MAGRIGLELGETQFTVEPGGAAPTATVLVRNDGSLVDQFLVRIGGLDPS
jgi:hypothetical protein